MRKFALTFFPHFCKYKFSSMHEDFFAQETKPKRRGRREATAAPRGNAKTTVKTTIKTIHAICYKYEHFILILGNSGDEADDKVREIYEELQSNRRLRLVFGRLLPKGRGKDGRSTKLGATDFITVNDIRVMAKSKGKQVRGLRHREWRPTLIICDDVEAMQETQTPEQRKKTRDWFFKDLIKAGALKDYTNIFFIGTVLHPEALLKELTQNPGWDSTVYKAVISWAKNQSLWRTWESLYNNLSNPRRRDDARRFYTENEAAMLDGTAVLWPDGESYYDLMEQRLVDGIAAFNSEKQNEPIDPTLQIFDMERAKRFKIVYDGHTPSSIHWLDGSGRVIPWSNLAYSITFHDPSLGRQPGELKEPDYGAVVTVAKDLDGFMYCLDAWIEMDPPASQIIAALEQASRWKVDEILLEEVAFQKLLHDDYRQQKAVFPGPTPNVRGVGQHSNKLVRIATLEPKITHGHLAFSDTLNPRLIEQLALFPTTKFDGPDALEGAVRELYGQSSFEAMESFYA